MHVDTGALPHPQPGTAQAGAAPEEPTPLHPLQAYKWTPSSKAAAPASASTASPADADLLTGSQCHRLPLRLPPCARPCSTTSGPRPMLPAQDYAGLIMEGRDIDRSSSPMPTAAFLFADEATRAARRAKDQTDSIAERDKRTVNTKPPSPAQGSDPPTPAP